MITIPHTTVIGGEIFSHKLTHIDQESSVLEASKLMRKSGTKELLVTGQANGSLIPLGIVTANDIVMHVVATELDPTVLTIGDIAWPGMPSANTAESDKERLCHLQEHKGEPIAVIDGNGLLVGTVRLDELLGELFH